jgi:hypothetical protein
MVALIRDEILEIGLSYVEDHSIDDIVYEEPTFSVKNLTGNC